MKNGPSKKDWLIGLIPLGLLFCCYLYGDMAITTTRGIVFWECIFDDVHNTIFDYVYRAVPNSVLPNGCLGADYDFLFYTFFALYDFPLWLLEKITGASFLDYWITKVYAKSIIILFLFISSIVLKKIVSKLTDDTVASWAQFFFVISSTVAHVIVVIGNYDIIAVTFILLGTYYYICEEDTKFVAFFAIAAVCKMFSFFVFIPLLLLRHKRIKNICTRLLASLLLIIIPKIVYVIYKKLIALADTSNQVLLQSSVSNEKIADNINYVGNKIIAHSSIVEDKLISGIDAPISMANIPMFIVATLILWWFAWKKTDVSNKDSIIISSMGIVIFFLFADTIPYWSILLLPYIVIYAMLNPSLVFQNAFIESVMVLSYIAYNMLTRLHIYQGRLIFDMIPVYRIKESIITNYSEPGFDLLVKRLSACIGISYEGICSCFLGVFTAALVVLVYSNIKHQNEVVSYDFDSIRKAGYIRMGVSFAVALIPVITIACRFINGRL